MTSQYSLQKTDWVYNVAEELQIDRDVDGYESDEPYEVPQERPSLNTLARHTGREYDAPPVSFSAPYEDPQPEQKQALWTDHSRSRSAPRFTKRSIHDRLSYDPISRDEQPAAKRAPLLTVSKSNIHKRLGNRGDPERMDDDQIVKKPRMRMYADDIEVANKGNLIIEKAAYDEESESDSSSDSGSSSDSSSDSDTGMYMTKNVNTNTKNPKADDLRAKLEKKKTTKSNYPPLLIEVTEEET